MRHEGTLVAGQIAGQPLDVFIAWDDAAAKTLPFSAPKLLTTGDHSRIIDFMMKLFDEETIQLTNPEEAAGLLVEVVPLVMRTIRHEIRAHRGPELTVPQVRALAFADRSPGAPLSELAEHLGLGRPSASKIADALVERGLLARETSPSDRRCVALRLTEEGMRVLKAARAATRERLAERLKALSGEELAAITQAMAVLRETFRNQG